MVTEFSHENVGGISNTALSIGIVLTRAPLPDLSVINMSFAGRMVEAQESARDDGDRILVVSDACEPATEFAVDVVGEVLVSDLCRKVLDPQVSQLKESLPRYVLLEVRNHSK